MEDVAAHRDGLMALESVRPWIRKRGGEAGWLLICLGSSYSFTMLRGQLAREEELTPKRSIRCM
jgi:hypothetical protein